MWRYLKTILYTIITSFKMTMQINDPTLLSGTL